MSTFYELRAAQYEYERRLRDAEHDRQVKRMMNANERGWRIGWRKSSRCWRRFWD